MYPTKIQYSNKVMYQKITSNFDTLTNCTYNSKGNLNPSSASVRMLNNNANTFFYRRLVDLFFGNMVCKSQLCIEFKERSHCLSILIIFMFFFFFFFNFVGHAGSVLRAEYVHFIVNLIWLQHLFWCLSLSSYTPTSAQWAQTDPVKLSQEKQW